MIEVRIPNRRFENDVHAGVQVVNELRDAGVPVAGAIWPRCDRGTLSVSYDEDFDEHVWRWEG